MSADHFDRRLRMIPGDAEAEAASRREAIEPPPVRGEPCGMLVAETAIGNIYCDLNPGHDGVCQYGEWARDNHTGGTAPEAIHP